MRTDQGKLLDDLNGRIVAWTMVLAIALACSSGCRRSSPPAPSSKQPDTAATARDDTPSDKGSTSPRSPEALPPHEASPLRPTEQGAQLYARHCAACHGERGDGKGIAATFLFPKPRDFRAGRFRLVSANNNVPTREDLQAVLVRGMPGSSMPPWAHLSQEERDALVGEVMRIRGEGARESYVKSLQEDEELTDEEIAAEDVQSEIQDYVDGVTIAGEGTVVPDIGPPADEAIARGKDVYAKFACIQCHGETGRGDGQKEMVDDEKLPTRPRDFTIGIFKGSPDSASLYRRIAYGMPGTPMPSSSGMTPEQMVDLVHYIRSMSTEEQRQAAVLKRENIVAKLVEAIPDSEQAEAWSQVEPVHLQTTPLWWRDESSRDPRVQAAHDGKTLALRISWNDPTHDDGASRADQFEDMVAAELFSGTAEPFLGMGASDAEAVDVWQWQAGAHDTGASDQQADDYPFDTPVYHELAKAAPLPDFLTARVVGNPLAVREGDGANLAAKGLGTLTFRPKMSQLVTARAAWNDGRWTVILQRPLDVSAQDGLPIQPGGHYSVAFAIWDGSARDRGPQKLITLWNDLQVE